jgi:hypothetical protein
MLKLGETTGEIEMYLLICEKRRKKKKINELARQNQILKKS